MDFDLKQWRDRDHHSQPTTPSPKLPPPSASSALPLFVSEPNSSLSAFPSDHPTRFPRMGSYFSSSQWQELELQALIFRHMIAGADVPSDLLHLVKKSLITSPFYLSHHYYQPSLLQSGYWGRAAMDPEPGRCRRTDGKKWRCSRDVVGGQKYCERHMHRGKNRSRKHVETATSAASPYGGGDALKTSSNSLTRRGVTVAGDGGGGPPHFTLSVPSHSTDLLHLNQRPLPGPSDAAAQPGGRTLRHLFDYETDNATNLSISMPGNPSSDFSLKLGTGNGDDPSAQLEGSERDKPQLNWGGTWETNPVASMGGPLAEVLRSSTSHSSPTSVLHGRLPRTGAPPSEPSF